MKPFPEKQLGMESRLSMSHDDLYNLQMEIKQVQYAQSNHAERLMRLERRQAGDTAMKSAWNSPFPGILGGTPQQDPVQIPHNDIFDEFDEQGEQLLGSLHLGPAEEEPVRRAAASRANSVRFDESALQSSSWSGANNRQSADLGPTRPGSSLLMERSLSYKSDGRHSSAGHSVHSHHSLVSGRASSLGVDTNFAAEDDEDSSFNIIGPPVSLYVLGSVPSIVRCWLTTNYAHSTLLYADICTGAQKSTVDLTLIQELQLTERVHHDSDGICRIRLNVYFAEAVIMEHSGRSNHSDGSVPSMTVSFIITGTDQMNQNEGRKAIRIFVGSDALRLYSADILLSRNLMMLSGNDGERLRVPFVRPEDDAVFRHICTANLIPEKPKLNANAAPFVLGGIDTPREEPESTSPSLHANYDEISRQTSPMASPDVSAEARTSFPTEDDEKMEIGPNDFGDTGKADPVALDPSRQESTGGIWGSWRHGNGNRSDGSQREQGPLSGYQPAPRAARNMKILKAPKSSASARTGASYEPPLPPAKSTGERRKSLASVGGESSARGTNRWDTKQMASSSSDAKTRSTSRESRNSGALSRTTNPVGVASAFSWMTPLATPKSSATDAG